ncbi:formimidoylglutamase [Simiduia aestuariiviva]|uniref:Formimidoylglutamase n=1 Tax=Simiduia aestuariiviva TaxID=1510459 RepID=A0A839UTH4_9GAMM|nr:formimidoylglutamase [Simiduia aestuariiviva]MBB3168655.1 formiminoglutamase [Simiduia aestuariiviva]
MSHPLYRAANPKLWTGRIDSEESSPALRWHQQMQCLDLSQPLSANLDRQVTLLGFASDAGVKRNKGRPGAAAGPDALRAALANSACADHPLYDAGDIICEGDRLESAQLGLAEHLAKLIEAQANPVVLGGGHEVAWASFQGLIPKLQQSNARLGIINFDAHLDLRRPNPAGSSGTPFRQIAEWCDANGHPFNYWVLGVNPSANTDALFQYAREKDVQWIEDDAFESEPLSALAEACNAFLTTVDSLYITVCLDVFNAAFAPGVSAPAALGISPSRMLWVFKHLIKQAKAVNKPVWLLDIAELNPAYDPHGQTARLGARIIWEYQRAQSQ